MKEQAFKMFDISSNGGMGVRIMSLKLHSAGNLILGCLAFCILNGRIKHNFLLETWHWKS